MPRLALAVARSKNSVIGRDNRLPWHLPEDLRRFKALTLGHPVIMGRKTFESIGRPLPGRRNIVITRDAAYDVPGCTTVRSIDEALRAAADADEAFVIGGAEIYALTLPRADRLYVTEVDAEIEGDTFFPDYDRSAFRELARERRTDEATGLAFDFVVYERIRSRGESAPD